MTGGTALRPRRRARPAFVAVGALLLGAIALALIVDRLFFAGSGTPPGTGSGIAATQARSLPRFTAVVLAGDNNVIIHVGARQSVIVHADDNLLARVTTRVSSRRLVIGNTPGNLDAKSPMFVVVSVTSLDRLALTGAGNIGVTGVHAPKLTVTLAGSGNIKATGTVRRLDVSIGGDGNAFLRPLVAGDASAVLGGSGSIFITATHSLAARVSGSGAIVYGGDPPHVTQTVTGSGTILAG